MSILLRPPSSPVRRAAGALLRSPVGALLEAITAPHGVDRYLELLDPLLARDTDRAVVTDIRHETPDTTTLTLRPSRWAGHRAGQYVRLTVEIDGRRHVRAYSVTSSAHRDDGQLTITVKADPNGIVSPFLAHRAVSGMVLGLSAAEGEFALPVERPTRLLLVSGGSGITPVMSILRTLADEGATTDVTFLHYARTGQDIPFAAELRELHARRGNVRVVTVLTRSDEAASVAALRGHLVPAHLDELFTDVSDLPTFVCGPATLIDAATAMWEQAGLSDLLHLERFQPATTVSPDAAATGSIAFARAGTSVVNDGRTLLDQAEAAGLTPQAGCRMGICHTCIKPKLTGQVRDVRDGRLSSCDPHDVQLCISVPVGDVTLDL